MTSPTTPDSAQAPEPQPASRRNRIILLLAAGLLLTRIYDVTTSPVEAKLLDVGDNMPEYSLPLLAGGEASSQKFLGKPALYYFYANWCPCSHESVANIRRAAEEGRPAGLSVMFVGIQDSQENLVKFANTHKLEFPVVAERGQTLADRVGVGITPTTVFVDKDGVIRGFFVGKVERYEQLGEGLKSIISSGRAPA